MRAVQFSEFGGPEVLEVVDLPEPHPEAGQIRVAVHAVGVNPIDWKVLHGLLSGGRPLAEPRGLGVDVAGVVEQASEG
ncbi:MAG: NADP-dependent oxidoreductase, partial [Solirubrobacteraceae bacterium]